jgi:long-chain acyl-CoA synthetase
MELNDYMGEHEIFYEKIKNYAHDQRKIALVDSEREITYASLYLEINEKIKIIKANSNEKEAIVNCGDNGIEFVLNHLAIISCNRISVPLDKSTTKDYLFYVLKEVKPALIIGEEINRKYDFEQIKSSKNKNFIKTKNNNKYPEDVNVIMYTSGSSGFPKGVMLGMKSILHTANNIINYCNYNKESFQLITIPISHSFGMGQLYSMLLCGGAAYVEKGMARGKRIRLALENYQITGFPTTPTGVELILTMYKELFLTHKNGIKEMIVNSAPLTRQRALMLKALLPNTKIYTYYGMTEASRSTMICLNDVHDDLIEHVGMAMYGNEVRINGENSEIVLSGKNLMIGYVSDFNENNEDYRAKKINSGDIGHINEEGYLKITGRIKDQINVGGYKVSPLEVEKILDEIDFVICSAVIGIENENKEEIVVAFLETKKPKIKEAEIYKNISNKLEIYKIPKKIYFIEKIPRIVNGKIDRLMLKKFYKGNIE